MIINFFFVLERKVCTVLYLNKTGTHVRVIDDLVFLNSDLLLRGAGPPKKREKPTVLVGAVLVTLVTPSLQ